jgi:predicted RNA methylase
MRRDDVDSLFQPLVGDARLRLEVLRLFLLPALRLCEVIYIRRKKKREDFINTHVLPSRWSYTTTTSLQADAHDERL